MQQQEQQDVESTFTVGDWQVDPGSLCIIRGESEVKLEPKVMQVLLELAREPGQVVSRQHLEDQVWQGVVVGYDSLGSTIIKLRKAFNDDPKNPAIIQTVPKKGYRIIAPVSFGEKQPGSDNPPPEGTASVYHNQKSQIFLVLLLLIALVLFFILPGVEHPESSLSGSVQRPGLAVLPFKNLSNDPEQEYFSDGITSDLITDLSNINSIAVIARSSVFTYKNSDIDIRKIGEELDVDYVIEGSVRKVDNKVRISARLIRAGNGVTVWADRFDAEFNNVFSIQDEVASKIVSSLEVKITEQEKENIARLYTNNIAAYDNFLQGWQFFWRYTKAGNEQAREYYIKAVEQDKNFARAYANLAVTHAFDYMNGWSNNPSQSLQQAHVYANKAATLDDALPQVQWAVGIVNTYSRNYEVALVAAEKSIKRLPNFADGYGLLATVLNFAGKPDQAMQVMQKAIQLNPRHPFIYKMILGQIHFNLHEYSDAEKYFTEATERNPTAQEVRLWLAATYAYLGKKSNASWELEQIRHSGVELSADYIEEFIPIKDPTLRKHFVDGLLKAGLEI